MFKFILLACFIVLLIAIDGELTYDILDFKIDTLFEWFFILVILAMAVGIYFVEKEKGSKEKKKSNKEKNS